MKYAFIEQNSKKYPVQAICKALNVSRSGYYKWLNGEPGPRELKRTKLLEEVKVIHAESRSNYGSPRIHRALSNKGVHCNKKTVAALMKENGIHARRKKKFKQTTDSKHNRPVAENILDRNFEPQSQDQAWAGDITYVWTDEGWLYLAVFIDLYSRKILGWSMSNRMTADLVLNAFRMAVFRRGKQVNPLVHSDRGSQYASELFTNALGASGCKQSMSRKGNCWDNACVESFFGSLKTELVHHEKFKTRAEAEEKLFEYMEIFYNQIRLHSTLNYMSPDDFELRSVCAG